MKKLWINKKAFVSLLLAGSITLCAHACGKANDDNKSEQAIDIVSTDVLDNNDQEMALTILSGSAYRPINDDNKYTILPDANIYYIENNIVTSQEVTHDLFMVTVLETNDSYSYCLFPNNTKGYVNNNYLIKCANLNKANYVTVEEDNNDTLSCNAYLYHSNGIYIGYLYEGQTCYVMATNGEYSLISLPDGTQGYVTNRSLRGDYKKIDGYAFLRKNTPVYRDNNLTDLAYNDYDDQLVNVSFINRKCAGIFDEDGRDLLYVNVTDLEADFIVIDLDSQQMNCYLNYQLAGSWKTRTGSDETPTNVGADDIDWKATDWDFIDYPGSHAKNLIVFNEDGQAIHDLVGDDEWNYGSQAYHNSKYGSHGCVRVPGAASEFVYDNYEVGDMVLVRRK